jgi:hypothetical protein
MVDDATNLIQIRPSWTGGVFVPTGYLHTEDQDFGVTAVGPLIAGWDFTSR